MFVGSSSNESSPDFPLEEKYPDQPDGDNHNDETTSIEIKSGYVTLNNQLPSNNQIRNESSETLKDEKVDTKSTEYRPILKTNNGYIAFHKVSQPQRRNVEENQSIITPLILEEEDS